MSEDVNKAAESSAAAVTEPVFDAKDQYTWSPEQREHWNSTGEAPVPPKKEEKQESVPAEPPAKEAKSDVAESETAHKQRKERKPGEKVTAEERISQLTAKVKELEERERSRPADTKPPSTEPAKAEAPKRPSPFNWKGTAEEYDAAMEKWEAHQRSEAIRQFQMDAQAEAGRQLAAKRIEEAKAKYADAQPKIAEACNAFEKAEIPGVIRAMLNDSEVLADLMYVMADKETRDNFIEASRKNPGKAIRALAQMETDIVAKRTAPAKVETVEKSDSKPAETKPRAPKPPSEVGGRGDAPEDVRRVAAAAGDFRGFEAEENRRKFAKN